MLQPGESVLTIRGPSLWYAVLRRFWVHAVCIVIMASAWRLAALGILPFSPGFSAALASTVLSISLLMGVATCAAEHYILTDRRLFVIKGVLARKSVQIPLTSTQEVRTNATIAQRLLGIGDVQASTAAPTVGCLMRCIRRPLQWADLLQSCRMAALRQQGTVSGTP